MAYDPKKGYDPDLDYHALANQSAEAGDYATAERYLTARGYKIQDQGGNDRGVSNDSIRQGWTQYPGYADYYQTPPVQTPPVQATAQQAASGAQSVQPAAATGTAALREQAQRALEAGQLSRADTSPFKSYLDSWVTNERERVGKQIDRATEQAVNETAKNLETAKEQSQTVLNQIDLNEARNKDNQALAAAARGDKGGIGAAQMDSIAAAAMTNRVTVQNARNKMVNDAYQRIMELRRDGEYEKADAFLQISNQYLSQLMTLEQWAQEYNLTVDQFNAQMRQWAVNFNLELDQLDVSRSQWAQEMAFQREQFEYGKQTDQRNFDYQVGRDAIADRRYEREYADQRADTAWQKGITERQLSNSERQQALENSRYDDETAYNRAMAERSYADNRSDTEWQKQQTERQQQREEEQRRIAWGESLLSAGMKPDAQTLKLMNLSDAEAELWISNVRNTTAMQSEQALAELENKRADTAKKIAETAKAGKETAENSMTLSSAQKMAENGVWTDRVYEAFLANGYDEATLEARYGKSQKFQTYIAGRKTSSGTGYGKNYTSIWKNCREMFDGARTATKNMTPAQREQYILDYLDKQSKENLSDEGFAYIMQRLNLGGARSLVQQKAS